jgi:hypothetical protein
VIAVLSRPRGGWATDLLWWDILVMSRQELPLRGAVLDAENICHVTRQRNAGYKAKHHGVSNFERRETPEGTQLRFCQCSNAKIKVVGFGLLDKPFERASLRTSSTSLGTNEMIDHHNSCKSKRRVTSSFRHKIPIEGYRFRMAPSKARLAGQCNSFQ